MQGLKPNNSAVKVTTIASLLLLNKTSPVTPDINNSTLTPPTPTNVSLEETLTYVYASKIISSTSFTGDSFSSSAVYDWDASGEFISLPEVLPESDKNTNCYLQPVSCLPLIKPSPVITNPVSEEELPTSLLPKIHTTTASDLQIQNSEKQFISNRLTESSADNTDTRSKRSSFVFYTETTHVIDKRGAIEVTLPNIGVSLKKFNRGRKRKSKTIIATVDDRRQTVKDPVWLESSFTSSTTSEEASLPSITSYLVDESYTSSDDVYTLDDSFTASIDYYDVSSTSEEDYSASIGDYDINDVISHQLCYITVCGPGNTVDAGLSDDVINSSPISGSHATNIDPHHQSVNNKREYLTK